MTVSDSALEAIFEIRDLLRLLAEPAVAERDQKRRLELHKIAGASVAKAKSILLMDGSRTQVEIHNETSMHKGDLSTLVKRLFESGLLVGDIRQPKLAIVVPQDFFEKET